MKHRNKKTIYFNVSASNQIGLGHLYRSGNIAQNLKKKYNIIFFGNKKTYHFYKKFKYNFKFKSYENLNIFCKIVKKNKPHIIINDRLDNSLRYIKELKKFSQLIINFEDNGVGNNMAGLSINELRYDNTKSKKNLYGYKYFILRKEFLNKNKIKYNSKIKNILITFGGTDPSNYTLKILKFLNKFNQFNINLLIVIGPGYKSKVKLIKYISKQNNNNIFLYDSIGKMSKIMSKVDFAFSSNGRTVLELAHMNVPGIILDQNKRESTHLFWKISKGFLNFNNFGEKNKIKLNSKFKLILKKNNFRKNLFNNLLKYNFTSNKQRIIKNINYFLENE